MTCAEDVYSELQQQTLLLEFDYYALCVRHPVPFTRPKISLHTTYPDAWVSQYQAENYFAIDPVLKPENFIQGHLPWNDALFSDAQTMWDAARSDEMVMAPEMRFSKREKEILKWTAEGKTSAEIAMILSISENTVNFHQKNMQKKFNAPNKTQIACYAAATGLI